MEEILNKKFIGEVTDTIIDLKTGEKRVIEHGHNLVVSNCLVLIAMLMKGDKGLAYLAVGSGKDTWDDKNLPEPTISDTQLLNETFRKKISPSDISFIDSNNEVSEVPTNRLKIVVTFNESEANGTLKELAFFGGSDATEQANSGVMINRKIHGTIYKTSGMKLERTIRFTF